MVGIRGKDTKPKINVRRLLHRLGYRLRLHRKDLPGRPDIVLPKWSTVIFWTNKIAGNRVRDERNYAALRETGWKVLILWESAVSKKLSLSDEQLALAITAALASTQTLIDIRG